MEDLYIHRYELLPRRTLSARAGLAPRHGALIRHGEGFADVHPWPELGDEPLDTQLARLARHELTPLTAASLRFARLDADARAASRSIFEVRDELLQIPPSHLLLTELDPRFDASAAAAEGFHTIKIKAGRDLARELQWLESRALELTALSVNVRIDCNAIPTAREFREWIGSFSADALATIAFIEDPFQYDAAAWRAVRSHLSLALAVDRDVARLPLDDDDAEVSADTLVVKPAVDEVDGLLLFASQKRRRVVVTSYMDHPVGQIGAAFVAARCAAEEPYIVERCGLLTHRQYQNDAFIERVESDGPLLRVPQGTGIGFDDLLEELPWKRLT
jgi:O-succinylbenzoate synthase